MTCPKCDAQVEGRFCGLCGAALEARRCETCGSAVSPGHGYCSDCGAAQGGSAASGTTPPSPNRNAWWIAGAAIGGAVLFLSVPYVWTGWAEGGDAERIPVGAPANLPAPGQATGVDLSSMTPREAADRLYNRVMTALSAGDDAEVAAFLPMAIDAYRLVPDLDADGRFHLSLLEQASGDFLTGLETAEQVLNTQPDHLLALYAAGEAARELGDTERAREHFGHLVGVYPAESVRDLPEYQEHANFLPTVHEAAREFLDTSGS